MIVTYMFHSLNPEDVKIEISQSTLNGHKKVLTKKTDTFLLWFDLMDVSNQIQQALI